MQLKERRSIRCGLIAASCALLGGGQVLAQDLPAGTASGDAGTETSDADLGDEQIDWLLDTSLAYYHENGRIQAIEPIIDMSKDDGNGELLDFSLTYDSLSGATPNGALPSNKPQTFAQPSGNTLNPAPHTYTTPSGQLGVEVPKLYTASPGALPMDPYYKDQRFALAGSWQFPLSRVTRWSVGGKTSFEHDFISLTANASIAHDFNEKNTTLLFGINDESDAIHPIGGTPVAASGYTAFAKTGSTTKNGVGALLSVTQVMSRRWLTQFNLNAIRFQGYLNDPYKILSVIDAAGNTLGYVYERRPGERTQVGAYLENRVAWERLSAALSLRYMGDDWHIRSDTAQFRLTFWNHARDHYLAPSARWYHQSAADFYRPWIPGASATSFRFASADQRLADFHALTYGLEYGIKLDSALDEPGAEFTVRAEYYQQILQHALPAPAALQGMNLYPGVRAILLQFGFSY
jgi:Protein of unknown function (DUF3570)